MDIDLDDLERKARAAHEEDPGEWYGQYPSLGWLIAYDSEFPRAKEHIEASGPHVVLALVAIARAAKAVRDARRQGLRGDYPQDLHDELSRALGDAGL